MLEQEKNHPRETGKEEIQQAYQQKTREREKEVRKMKKKMLMVLLGASMVLSPLTAFADGEKTKVTFYMWAADAEQEFDRAVVAQYEEEHPDIDIEENSNKAANIMISYLLRNNILNTDDFWSVDSAEDILISSDGYLGVIPIPLVRELKKDRLKKSNAWPF